MSIPNWPQRTLNNDAGSAIGLPIAVMRLEPDGDFQVVQGADLDDISVLNQCNSSVYNSYHLDVFV
jgi:hypothetical protein